MVSLPPPPLPPPLLCLILFLKLCPAVHDLWCIIPPRTSFALRQHARIRLQQRTPLLEAAVGLLTLESVDLRSAWRAL